uniref:Per os infectivity factor 2 n=1 Tax=Phthorimaea operculella granulovirus TaxID=192584 RepID=A0A1B2CS14_9BBAC|nr:hypothetical protein PhopGVgp044 [Phthorimaea operculella granulovirus]
MYIVLVIIFVLFIFIMYIPLHKAYTNMYEDAVERNLFLEENREPRPRYAPLHTLPTLRWHASFNTTGCFSVPTRVTDTDYGTFDCTLICDNPSAVYFFVHEHDMYIVNGEKLPSGGYCTLNSVPRNCNSETSIILHSVNQWTCIAEDPRYFAGEANLLQIAGRQHSTQILSEDLDKIVLYDKLLNRVVNPSINTFRQSWDETMENGSRRFQVVCDQARDIHYNQLFTNPLNPIECLPNVCTNVNFVHRDVKPVFERGICDCGSANITRVEHIDINDPSSKCASITNRRNGHDYNFRVECLSLDSPITEYTHDKLMCPPSIFNQNTDFAYTFTLRGVVPLSGNGIDEPTTRLYRETRNRINWNDLNR